MVAKPAECVGQDGHELGKEEDWMDDCKKKKQYSLEISQIFHSKIFIRHFFFSVPLRNFIASCSCQSLPHFNPRHRR